MFIKYIAPHNKSETLINKDKIKFIENISTANNLNRTLLTLNVHLEKDMMLNLIFEDQSKLDDFLRQATQ